jgi:hypothetical protein
MVATRGFLRAVASFTLAASVIAGSLLAAGGAPPAEAASTAATVTGGPVRPTVSASETLTITATISNTGTSTLKPGALTLTPSSTALLSENELTTWLAGKGYNANPVGDVAVGAIAPRSAATVLISVPARVLPQPNLWGVRGLELSYSIEQMAVSTVRSSVVLRAGQAPTPVLLATILPLVGPASALGMMTSNEIAETTAPTGYLAKKLAAATVAPVTLAVDPRITTSILALGNNAPSNGTAWLKTLATSQKTGFWLSYADSDTAGLIQAGAEAPLSPSISDVANIPAPPSGSNWGGSSWPGWAPSLANISWPVANTVSKAVVKAVAAAGDTRMLVSSDNLEGQAPASAIGRTETTQIVTVNAPASACAQALEVSQSSAARASASACLASRLAVAATGGSSGTTVVVALSRSSATFSVGGFGATLDELSTLDFTKPVALDAVLTARGSVVTIAKRSESASRRNGLKRALGNQTKIINYSPVADDPTVVINPGERRLAAVASSAWMGKKDWNLGLDANTSLTSEVLSSVSIVTSSTINMVSGQARIPVVIRNDLATRVEVTVHAMPSNARISVAGAVPLKIEGNSQARAYIPVTARVGNGRVALEVSLTDTAGGSVGAVANLPVNVRADWETFGIWGLALVFFALIIAGVIRTIRRNRRKSETS